MADEITDVCGSINEDNSIDFSRDNNDVAFDKIIGHIEDLLLDDGFQKIQQMFLDKYWQVFEPVDENKLIYTDIFKEYNKAIESYIINYLQKAMPHFCMNSFLKHLEEKRSELDGEVFEVLSTFTDFMAFKEMFLDYRAVKEGKVEDLSCGIEITPLKFLTVESAENL